MENTTNYTKPEWNSETRRFECHQNGFGQWWPTMLVKCPGLGGMTWASVIIRDSNPFKTLKSTLKKP